MAEITENSQVQETPGVIENTMIPVKNPGVTVREEMEEDGKYILFNGENELILVINPTGKFILDNCDGEKTVDQIVTELRDAFTVKEDIDLSSITKKYVSTLLLAELVKIKEEGKVE
jgi:hypothetical protein